MTEVRPARTADRNAVRRVVEAAFGDEGVAVADLVDSLSSSGALRSALVAESQGVVVGHVGLSRGWVDAREALVDVLVLSPLSVSPDHQGAGTGTLLVRTALAAALEQGAPAVFLEGSPTYYAARGFARASTLGFVRPSVRIPDAAFQVALLPPHEPWMTGRLVYPDAFWRQDSVGLRDPLLAELEARFAD